MKFNLSIIFAIFFIALLFVFDSKIQASPEKNSLFKTHKYLNPIDDEETIVLSIRAVSGKNYYGDYPSLYIRSSKSGIDLYINWKTYIGSSERYVTHRVGKRKSTGTLWGISSDGTKTFYPKNWYVSMGKATFYPELAVEELIRQMTKSKQFVVQIKPYGESTHTVVFDTTDLKKHAIDLGLLSIKNPVPKHIKKQIEDYNKDIWMN